MICKKMDILCINFVFIEIDTGVGFIKMYIFYIC